jgi:N-formylglutamate amidohydrolase
MKLPLLISVPHAGTEIPPEAEGLCRLTRKDIIRDGDEGAESIYGFLQQDAAAYVTTGIARAIVDMNRSPDDFSSDGVVKLQTCQGVPVYNTPLSDSRAHALINAYYRPYHEQLRKSIDNALLGIDCHTMAATAPLIAADAGSTRPFMCLSNAGFTCTDEWLSIFAGCLESAFRRPVSLNSPFQGGYIIRSHAGEVPWVQLELTRRGSMSAAEKKRRLAEALVMLCERIRPVSRSPEGRR